MVETSKVERKIIALVVDDDDTTGMVEGAPLRKYGLETKTVKNGKEAVDLFHFLAGNSFDLVLMDLELEMPVMDGSQATRALRGMGVNCMIVGATSRGEQEVKDEFLSAGLDFCWEKPLGIHDYMAIVDELAKKLQI